MPDLIIEHDLHTMYRLIKLDNGPEIVKNEIVSRSAVSNRVTRGTVDEQLQIPRFETAFARRSFLYRAIQSWNQLPRNVRICSSFANFKSKLAKYLGQENDH